MATDIRAELRNCGVSAQKVRLVVDLVRGKPAVDALNTLKFMPKVAARHVRKLLASAVANAEENLASAAMTCSFIASRPMKLPPASGAALAPAAVSSRCCGGPRTSPLS